MNIWFTADLHGNISQYEKLFEGAAKNKPKAIILGGDLTPKDKEHRTPRLQRAFLEKGLFPLIKRLHRTSSTEVMLILGNDDFKSNLSWILRQQKKYGFVHIHDKVLPLDKNISVIGYSYVPITPYIYKDWEKRDLAKGDEQKMRPTGIAEGYLSKGNVLVPTRIDTSAKASSIERDLNEIWSKVKTPQCICAIHAPPYNTPLDINYQKEHVGSRAMRKFIEEKQPWITLHGHIHETVKQSSIWKNKIGKTTCASVGNDHRHEEVWVLAIDTSKGTLKRFKIN